MYRLYISLKLNSNVIIQRHISKLSSLRNQTKLTFGENPAILIRQIVNNFSSYHLKTEEEKALSFRLDGHITTGLNRNKLVTEFEIFYQKILNNQIFENMIP